MSDAREQRIARIAQHVEDRRAYVCQYYEADRLSEARVVMRLEDAEFLVAALAEARKPVAEQFAALGWEIASVEDAASHMDELSSLARIEAAKRAGSEVMLAEARKDLDALAEGKVFQREDIDGDFWIAFGVFDPLTQMPPMPLRFATRDEALAAYRSARSTTGGEDNG